jgi:hypothetical protein
MECPGGPEARVGLIWKVVGLIHQLILYGVMG